MKRLCCYLGVLVNDNDNGNYCICGHYHHHHLLLVNILRSPSCIGQSALFFYLVQVHCCSILIIASMKMVEQSNKTIHQVSLMIVTTFPELSDPSYLSCHRHVDCIFVKICLNSRAEKPFFFYALKARVKKSARARYIHLRTGKRAATK